MNPEKYEILYDLKAGEYNQTQVGGIRTKVIRAGDTIEIEAFPIVRLNEAAERERQRRKSSPAQDRLNQENARKKFRRLAEANFTRDDWRLDLTLGEDVRDFGMLNKREEAARAAAITDEDVRRMWRNYLEKLRRRVKGIGGDPGEIKYQYVIEGGGDRRDTDPEPLPGRMHMHVMLHAPGLSRDTIEQLWEHGYSSCQHLDTSRNGLKDLAAYLTKSRRWGRRWGRSKNLVEPDVRVSDRAISRRRAALAARDVEQFGREITEGIYKGYRCEEVTVRYSDFVAGAYIFVRMRRRTEQAGSSLRARVDNVIKGARRE